MENILGKKVSHYKILENLGSGGMGIVYKAEDTKLRRTVALKFITPDKMKSPEFKARFFHEAQAAAALDHPYICNVFEVAQTEEGVDFIAMENLEGETLQDRLE